MCLIVTDFVVSLSSSSLRFKTAITGGIGWPALVLNSSPYCIDPSLRAFRTQEKMVLKTLNQHPSWSLTYAEVYFPSHLSSSPRQPNTLQCDGSKSLANWALSPDKKLFAFVVSTFVSTYSQPRPWELFERQFSRVRTKMTY